MVLAYLNFTCLIHNILYYVILYYLILYHVITFLFILGLVLLVLLGLRVPVAPKAQTAEDRSQKHRKESAFFFLMAGCTCSKLCSCADVGSSSKPGEPWYSEPVMLCVESPKVVRFFPSIPGVLSAIRKCPQGNLKSRSESAVDRFPYPASCLNPHAN